MATLEEKFTELQGLLSTNHTALLGAIATQQSSLDTIAINSGLQSAALGLIKLDTGGLGGKLDTIVQLLTDLNAATIAPDTRLDFLANLARLETMQDDMVRVRKILATTTQYAASDTGQVSTIFGRLDNSLLQLAGVFVGPDGYFPGSSTTFGGVLASIFLNLVSIEATNSDMREIFDGPANEFTIWRELNLLRLSATYIKEATETSAVFLGTHTPILEAIRDCTCAATAPPGGDTLCTTYTGTVAGPPRYAMHAVIVDGANTQALDQLLFFQFNNAVSEIVVSPTQQFGTSTGDGAIYVPTGVPVAVANTSPNGLPIQVYLVSQANMLVSSTLTLQGGTCATISAASITQANATHLFVSSSSSSLALAGDGAGFLCELRYGSVG